MCYELMGVKEGVLTLPTGKQLAINIDYVEMSCDAIPEMRISVIPGRKGRMMIDDHNRRQDSKRLWLGASSFIPNKTPAIEKVIFNDPATIVIWSDGTKTVVKCQDGDTYSKELGLAMCISKKFLGNKGNFNETFKKYIEEV